MNPLDWGLASSCGEGVVDLQLVGVAAGGGGGGGGGIAPLGGDEFGLGIATFGNGGGGGKLGSAELLITGDEAIAGGGGGGGGVN